jgi:uncharacterized protein (UPF0262 family)
MEGWRRIGKARDVSFYPHTLWKAGTKHGGPRFAIAIYLPAGPRGQAMNEPPELSQADNRIARITLDEASVLARNAEIEKEREVALRDLVEDNLFRPLRALEQGHAGPWHVHLAIVEGMLALGLTDCAGRDAGTIGLGLARLRRVVREYFAICDSYYKALRRASAQEIETIDMARRGIHDRGTRQLAEALENKIETDFDTARRLFTLICVLHIKA